MFAPGFDQVTPSVFHASGDKKKWSAKGGSNAGPHDLGPTAGGRGRISNRNLVLYVLQALSRAPGTKGAMVYRSPENGLAAGWQEGGKGVVVPGERGGRKGAPGWQDREKRVAIRA